MKYTHLSRERFDFDRSHIYVGPDRSFKPNGFWYQVDGDWQRCCEDEAYEIGKHYLYGLTLDRSKFHVITDWAEMRRFCNCYKGRKPYEVLWDAVMLNHTGIEIAPYLWACRMEDWCEWYYPWECASGCVWDLSAVIKCQFLKEVVFQDRYAEQTA